MSLYLKKQAEPEAFQEWRKKNKEKYKELFKLLYSAIRNRDVSSENWQELRYFILRACYDAAHFENISKEQRSREKDSIANVKSSIKAIEKLETFCSKNPEASKIIAGYWLPEVYGSSPNHPDRLANKNPMEILLYNLDRLKYSADLYAKKAQEYSYFSIQHGPLLIPRTEHQERIKPLGKPDVDGLIYELDLLIHLSLQNIPITADIMEIPTGSRFKEGDGIISRIVNETLNENTTSTFVRSRLDFLKKKNVKWIDWEQYYQP